MLKFYEYAKCSTCRNAKKFLQEREIEFTTIPIREKPPTSSELASMLEARDGRTTKILNTSSQDYRDIGLKDKLPNIPFEELCELLQKNGNLVKRPFLIGDKIALNGFKEEEWREAFET